MLSVHSLHRSMEIASRRNAGRRPRALFRGGMGLSRRPCVWAQRILFSTQPPTESAPLPHYPRERIEVRVPINGLVQRTAATSSRHQGTLTLALSRRGAGEGSRLVTQHRGQLVRAWTEFFGA